MVRFLSRGIGTLRGTRDLRGTAGARVRTACDSSCIMQIGGAMTRRKIDVKAVHLAQLLAGEA